MHIKIIAAWSAKAIQDSTQDYLHQHGASQEPTSNVLLIKMYMATLKLNKDEASLCLGSFNLSRLAHNWHLMYADWIAIKLSALIRLHTMGVYHKKSS
jgi:hypothetical protein